MGFHQARWTEPLLNAISKGAGRWGGLPKLSTEEVKRWEKIEASIPKTLRRTNQRTLPSLTEVESVRHFTRLSEMCYGVDSGIYPLGSCTMKYTPKLTSRIAGHWKVKYVHPRMDCGKTQGLLRIMFELSEFLAEIVGMDKFSLQPAAGAQGELAGTLIIRAYHREKGELDDRKEIIVPDSAHGTNPASASMAGFKVVVVPSGEDGTIDVEALKSAVGKNTAGLMITNPNTLGLFEKNIVEVAEIIHEAGGLLYYDGANLNAILGIARPGDMGFDIAHVNLHKTFSTPHGGGGPGSGPVGVKAFLDKFLPVPTVEFDGKQYYLDYDRPYSVGSLTNFYGNVSVLIRAYAYILIMGAQGLRRAAEVAVLNSNYVANALSKLKGFTLAYPGQPRKHEFVLSAQPMLKEQGVRALDVSKRLLDYGIHAPTHYFPSIVPEALMVEPTETETKRELDGLIEAFKLISEEAYSHPDVLRKAPVNTAVGRVDEVRASHPKTMKLTW
ncbi:MAG: aminomethyl-transferring glycine dehydrogenase subunit GcvPB [Candidatus Bathyarchaeia archaeon]